MRMRVVLPQPDGPRMEKNEPLGIPTETSSTARTGPKLLETASHSRSNSDEAVMLARNLRCRKKRRRRPLGQGGVSDYSTPDQPPVAALIFSSALPSMSSTTGGMLAKD